MVGMKHWPFQYTTHFIPQLKTMVVTSRRKRFVELSQQQRIGLDMSDTEQSLLLCEEWI
jgi:hypothetical protein